MPIKNLEERKIYYKKYNIDNKKKIQIQRKGYRQRKRLKALNIVGKCILKCVMCGCENIDALTINHNDSNGSKDREENTRSIIDRIVDGSRKTDDLSIMCYMCNWNFYQKYKFGLNYTVIFNGQDKDYINPETHNNNCGIGSTVSIRDTSASA